MNIAVELSFCCCQWHVLSSVFFQFRRKGFLFNNAYLYAGKREKENE